MENSLIDPNKGIIFHPVYSDNTTTEEKNKIAEHVDKHYRKYLF